MNLANRDYFRVLAAGVQQLLRRYPWDGVDLTEVYFESLEESKPATVTTPSTPSPCLPSSNTVAVARRIEEEWLDHMEIARKSKPDLDVVLTYVDDRFDSSIRNSHRRTVRSHSGLTVADIQMHGASPNVPNFSRKPASCVEVASASSIS